MHSPASLPVLDSQEGLSFLPALDRSQLPTHLVPRSATIGDVDGMSALINEYASARIMLARGPLYLYQSIKDYMVISTFINGRSTVLACAGLHVLWEDLAEVRSVAVLPSLQKQGLGRALVHALMDEARKLGVHHLFTFTLAGGFFDSLGFKEISRDQIPPVVWAECSKCPKFYKCDEIGMMYHL